MSVKPTEEGWFWEWRAFGEVPESIVARARSRAARGTPGVVDDDLYLVSDATDQNVKLRADGAFLKLKPLLARLADGCELYEEALRLLYPMPARADALARAAALLGVDVGADAPLGKDELLAALAAEGIDAVRVRKRRSQYVDGGGWLEVAELDFPGGNVMSLGIQSPTLAETRRIRAALDPEAALAPMSYVEACRRWRA